MRIFLAMALAASLFVAAGCSCATGDCGAPVVDDCAPCAAPAAPVVYEAPAPIVTAAPVVRYAPPVAVEAAPVPMAVAPITCNPCAGL